MDTERADKPFKDLMDCISAGQFTSRALREAADAIWEAAKRLSEYPSVLTEHQSAKIMKLVASGLHTQAGKLEEAAQ